MLCGSRSLYKPWGRLLWKPNERRLRQSARLLDFRCHILPINRSTAFGRPLGLHGQQMRPFLEVEACLSQLARSSNASATTANADGTAHALRVLGAGRHSAQVAVRATMLLERGLEEVVHQLVAAERRPEVTSEIGADTAPGPSPFHLPPPRCLPFACAVRSEVQGGARRVHVHASARLSLADAPDAEESLPGHPLPLGPLCAGQTRHTLPKSEEAYVASAAAEHLIDGANLLPPSFDRR